MLLPTALDGARLLSTPVANDTLRAFDPQLGGDLAFGATPATSRATAATSTIITGVTPLDSTSPPPPPVIKPPVIENGRFTRVVPGT
jgi:hypothetical protein